MARSITAADLGRLFGVIVLCLLNALALPVLAQTTDEKRPLFRVNPEPPPGFEELSAKHTTEADVFYGGRYLMSAFVEYDLYTVQIIDPVPIVEAIPNLKNPEGLAAELTGPRPTNAGRICSSRVRQNCGSLTPEVVDVIFDDSNFRLDLFLSPDELLIHHIERERYLPPANGDSSTLHNLRLSLSGTSSDGRYNLSSESFFAQGASRIRARYGLSDDGASLYELTWQRDDEDLEYEVGSFRTIGRNLSFTNDLDVLGVRVATSTKRRTDLDQATGTPLLVFLPERSRVDVFRNDELIDSRFYDAGNQQIDTSGFPEGAYNVELRITGSSGNERRDSQFFVRNESMPPPGETHAYLEVGGVMNTLDQRVPEMEGEQWIRVGFSSRLRQNLSMDNELAIAGQTGILQSGFLQVFRNWHLYTGALVSSDADYGFAFRGGFQHGDIIGNMDFRKVVSSQDAVPYDEFALVGESYTQGTATIAFPLGKNRMLLRGRINKRRDNDIKSLGFSYWGALFRRGTLLTNFNIDGAYARQQSWIQAGVEFRWQRQRDSTSFRPRIRREQREDDANRTTALIDGRWNSTADVKRLGEVHRSLYVTHDADRSSVGARFVPQEYPFADAEIGYQRSDRSSDIFYAMNSRMSIVTIDGQATFGDGGNDAGAVLIHVTGDLQGRFEILVDNRVVGYAEANVANVISLRPYETYRIRIRPIGDKIIGFDQSTHEVTLYPGNVQILEFTARQLTVLIGQAVYADGSPVAAARFANVEGYGATDRSGWFQVEFAHRDPLKLQPRDGEPTCQIEMPDLHRGQDLAVLGELICQPIQDPQ